MKKLQVSLPPIPITLKHSIRHTNKLAQKHKDAKKKLRHEKMQEKYVDYTVVMEVVQVILDVNEAGQQKERYGMWKDYANEGMDKTTTCLCEYLFPLSTRLTFPGAVVLSYDTQLALSKPPKSTQSGN